MKLRTKKTFEEFVKTLKKTNRDWAYWTSYEKAIENFEIFEELIHKLGKCNEEQFREKFIKETTENKHLIQCTPLFSAIRADILMVIENGKESSFDFKSITPNEAMTFLENVGFFQVFEKLGTIDVPSYYLGTQVGMDTNGRKNRGGKLMEKWLRDILIEQGLKPIMEVSFNKIESIYGVKVIKEKSKNKRFDAAFIKDNTLYLCETNFFGSGGSKINETLRSFIGLEREIREEYKSDSDMKIEFIYITDGKFLTSDKDGLKDALKNIKNMFNIDDVEQGLFI